MSHLSKSVMEIAVQVTSKPMQAYDVAVLIQKAIDAGIEYGVTERTKTLTNKLEQQVQENRRIKQDYAMHVNNLLATIDVARTALEAYRKLIPE